MRAGVVVYRYFLLFVFTTTPVLHAQATTPVSSLQFELSDPKLVQAFQWAKSQALVYAHDHSDPVGPWYEAALPGRDSFCMPDVSHQPREPQRWGYIPRTAIC